MSEEPDPEVPARAKRSRQYSARYKLGVLAEYEQLDKAGKGALLRREGLYSSLISEWRKQRDRGALEALAQPQGRKPADPAEREATRLRRENERLERELGKARRVIEVQGNSPRCWTSSLVSSSHPKTLAPPTRKREARRTRYGR